LNFPDSEYNTLVNELEHNNETNANMKVIYKNHTIDYAKSLQLNNVNNHTVLQNNNLNINNSSNNINNFQNTNNLNSNGIIKQNSQLLPKRHGVHIATRSSSQKNVDFKSIFNNSNPVNDINFNRNLHSSTTNRDESTNINNSNSPSPDFIAAAMSPIKTNNITLISNQGSYHLNSASSNRNSKQTNFQDNFLQKKNLGHVNNHNPITSSHNNINLMKNSNEVQSRNSAISNGETRMDHYYVHLQSSSNSNNNNNLSDDNYQQVLYHQPNVTENRVSNINNNNLAKTSVYNRNQIRSLPGSIYRGSPERSLPRSPDRADRQIDFNNNILNNRPTTSRVSPTRQAETPLSEKNHDSNNQKIKVVNYLSTKRSLTSCDETGFERNSTIKSRQLPMGKAKIELDTQTSNYLQIFKKSHKKSLRHKIPCIST
jgi:hypothetical protein